MKVEVHWPAVVCLSGIDELYYVENIEQWRSDSVIHEENYTLDDQLIDSLGYCYAIVRLSGYDLSLKYLDKQISLDGLTELVRMHALQSDACCVSKLFINAYLEGIESVRLL